MSADLNSPGPPGDGRISRFAPVQACWRNIVILSWPVDEARLLPHLPDGLVLARWNGAPYISLVCLMMENLRVFGVPALPRKFVETNLRFYVRSEQPDDARPGVVFLRQLVSSRLVALGGRFLLRESMSAAAMEHAFGPGHPGAGGDNLRLKYAWSNQGRKTTIRVTASGAPFMAQSGSLEEFLTARHWGYVEQSVGRVRSYRISREAWQLVPVVDCTVECDDGAIGGASFSDVLAGPPASALVVRSSDARIHWPSSR